MKARAATLCVLFTLLNASIYPGIAVAESNEIRIHGAAVVYKHGKKVFEHYEGLANVAWDIPITASTRFRIGSVTKPMVAAIVLELVANKQLALDDTVSKWLPDSSITDADKIRIDHLLSHSSGLYHFPDSDEFNALRATIESGEELLTLFASQPLAFPTGTQWGYSNANYVLLGLIAERASGLSFADLVQRYIAQPSGRTGIADAGLYKIVPHLAEPYYRSGTGDYSGLPPVASTARFAAGSITASADDMALWMLHLLANRQSEANIFEVMTKPVLTLPAGVAEQAQVPPRYAYGWFVGESLILGCPAYVVEHGGSILGYNSRLRFLPEHDLVISIATNTTDGVQAVVDELTRRFMNDGSCAN